MTKKKIPFAKSFCTVSKLHNYMILAFFLHGVGGFKKGVYEGGRLDELQGEKRGP